MKLTFDTLRKHLSGEPARAYLVSGDEALLVGEAADAIRAAAKRAGFEEREVFFIERVADWEAVRGATNNLSLFGSRKLIEIRLPSGKPGTGGSNSIAELLNAPNPDNIYLMLTGKLEREQTGAAWVKAFETAGAWLSIWPVDVAALPQWLRNRAAAMEVQLDDKAVQLIVERTEGNLLAAHQELQKLKLTIPDGKVGVETVQASLGDSARFDVFQLGEAALAGDVTRALRILAGLRSEGVEPTLALWSLAREIHNTWGTTQNDGYNARSWQRPSPMLETAKRRAGRLPYARLAARLSRADRMIKGQLRPGDAWDEMALLIVEFAGRRVDLAIQLLRVGDLLRLLDLRLLLGDARLVSGERLRAQQELDAAMREPLGLLRDPLFQSVDDLPRHDLVPRLGADLDDAAPHKAGAEHADLLDLLRTHRLSWLDGLPRRPSCDLRSSLGPRSRESRPRPGSRNVRAGVRGA